MRLALCTWRPHRPSPNESCNRRPRGREKWKGMVVISEPESPGTQSSSEGLVPPTPAEAAPVALPGAPPPPPHEAVEAAHELERETAANESAPSPVSVVGESAETFEPAEEEPEPPFAAPLELIDETVSDEDLKFDWYILKVQVNRED